MCEPLRLLLFLLFLFFLVVVVIIVVVVGIEIFVFELRRLLFLAGLAFGARPLLELEVDPDVAELRVEELEKLVGIVAGPLVEQIGQELEEIAAIEATLDFFDLLFAESFEDVFAQRLDVALIDRVLRGQANLTNGAFVEIDLHELNGEYANHPGRVNARVSATGLC
jgi:hypothetical protein